MIVGLAIYPTLGLKAFFLDQRVIFDGSNYLNIALNGYTSWELTAFYPLWPLFLRALSQVLPASILVISGIGFAVAMFAVSVFLFSSFLKQRFSSRLVAFIGFLYVMNPNSFFHAQLYPESLSALLITAYMWLPQGNRSGSVLTLRKTSVFLISALNSLTRPWLPYFVIASLGAWLIIIFFGDRQREQSRHHFMGEVLPLILGSCVGYALYGAYTYNQFGSFWEAFLAQKNWGRDLALHWSLIVAPKSVGGSDHVLFWDIQAFYLPWILLIAAGWLILVGKGPMTKWMNLDAVVKLRNDFLFWFFGLMSVGLSLTAFLSYPIFMSLGRHIFTSPPIFYCLAAILSCFKKPVWLQRTLVLYAVVSVVFLVMWGTRYSKGSWMG